MSTHRPYDDDYKGLEIASQYDGKSLLLTELPDNEIENYSKRSLAAQLFCDWIEEKPLDEILKEHPEMRDADFYEIGEVLEWLGDALVKIAILNEVPQEITDKILVCCNRAAGGVKEELLNYLQIEGVRRKSARRLYDAGLYYDSLNDLDHKTLSKIVGPIVSKRIRDYFKKMEIEGEKIYDGKQIYKEIDDIIIEEKQLIETSKKLEKTNQNISPYLTTRNLKERYEKIVKFCQNELTWVHSDSKYFRFFTNHGTPHSSNVLNNIFQLLDEFDLKLGERRLDEYEMFLLAVCAWCHDLGMLCQDGENFDDFKVVEKARKEHAKRIGPYLDKNYLRMGLSDEIEKKLISQICLHHSSNEDIAELEENQEILLDSKVVSIRTKLISALLRLSDALDIDKNRLPREENRNNELISDITKKEYKKHEIVQRVAIDTGEGCILVQILIDNSDAEHAKVCGEVQQKLNEEFESVKNILLDHGINIKCIKFLVI